MEAEDPVEPIQAHPEMVPQDIAEPEIVAPPEEPIYYGPVCRDEENEYLHIVLPESYKKRLHQLATGQLMSQMDLRELGIIVQPGWQHCFIWRPPRQPPVIFLRRSLALPPENLSLDRVENPLLVAPIVHHPAPAHARSASPAFVPVHDENDDAGIAAILDIWEMNTKMRCPDQSNKSKDAPGRGTSHTT